MANQTSNLGEMIHSTTFRSIAQFIAALMKHR